MSNNTNIKNINQTFPMLDPYYSGFTNNSNFPYVGLDNGQYMNAITGNPYMPMSPNLFLNTGMEEMPNNGVYLNRTPTDMSGGLAAVGIQEPAYISPTSFNDAAGGEDAEKIASQRRLAALQGLYSGFGGVDLNTALFKVGQGLSFDTDTMNLSPEEAKAARRGNTLRTIGAIGKSVLGSARGVMAGVGYEKRRQQVLAEYFQRQRQAQLNYDDTVGEDGGEFANGGFQGAKVEIRNGKKYINGKPVLTQDEFLRRSMQTGTGVKTTVQSTQLFDPMTGMFNPVEEPTPPPTFRGNPLIQKGERDFNQEAFAFNQLPNTGYKKSVSTYNVDRFGMTNNQLEELPEEQFVKLVTPQANTPRIITINGQKYVNGKPVMTQDQFQNHLNNTGARPIGQYPLIIPPNIGNNRIVPKGADPRQLIREFRDGGILTTAQKLTGEYQTGLSEHMKHMRNANVEDQEYVKPQEGEVLKVLGKRHEDGGEDVALPEGTKVISDNLTIGGSFSNTLRKDYGISTRAKDTYAKVMDKYTDKIGLTQLNKEQEELIKKVEKERDTKDATTSNLNLEYLSERINEIEQKKKPLLEMRNEFFEKVFAQQESTKSPKEDVVTFEDGGTMKKELLTKLSEKYGLSLQEAKDLVNRMQNNYGEYDKKALGMRNSSLKNPDGSASTHKFAYAEVDGKFVAYPTLFQKDNGEFYQVEDSGDDFATLREAYERGEVFEFDNEADAKAFALGSWKMADNAETEDSSNNNQTPTRAFQNVMGRNEFDMPMLADQSVLPPDALFPHVKMDRRYDTLDPIKLSNEENIKQIDAQTKFSMRQLSNLPDSQNKAVLANLIASGADAVNKSEAQVAAANIANEQQTAQINLQQQGRQEDSRVIDSLDFEKRQLTALGITNEDVRNYFDYNRRVGIQNRNDIQRFNLLNNLYDNFNINPFGGVAFDPNSSVNIGTNISGVGNAFTRPQTAKVSMDMTNMSDKEFKKAYGLTKENYQKALKTMV